MTVTLRRILIMGLPGSGKTFLARELCDQLMSRGMSVTHLNADAIREQFNDWDFSAAGRLRQAQRMRDLADSATADLVIADFVAPLPDHRMIFDPDCLIYVNTIDQGRYADTNQIFQAPACCDFVVTTQDACHWAQQLINCLFNK